MHPRIILSAVSLPTICSPALLSRSPQVWRYLVLDEGHKVKNEETRVSDGMRHISRQQVLMLTGEWRGGWVGEWARLGASC